MSSHRRSPSPVCYGSVRAALLLGPDATVSHAGERESASMRGDLNKFSQPPDPPPSSSFNDFWSALHSQENTAPYINSLRYELVMKSREAMSASIAAKKRCPHRRRVEQHLTDTWRQAAAASATVPPAPIAGTELTPLGSSTPHPPIAPHRTPDPLHSPYPRF